MASVIRVLRRARPAYGWVIIVVAALAMVATLPGRTHGLGMITERLLSDQAFELTRVSYGEINLWATLLGSLFCLPCGWLIDRLGLRATLTVTVASLAAVVLWMARLRGNDSLFVAILLTRGFGQSALSVISITMVGKWYRGRLGMPMAIYTLLLSLGFAAAPRIAKPFADADWRVVWDGMGWALLLGVTPLVLLLTCDPQERAGAESKTDEDGLGHGTSPRPLEGFTLLQAVATPAFWVFGMAISIVALIGSGVSLFNESVLSEQGFPKTTFLDLMSWTFMIGLIFKLPIGWLIRSSPLGRLQAVALALQAALLFWLPQIRTLPQLVVYAIGTGLAGTITTVLFFTIWGQAFGRAHLGQIQGVAQMMTVLASALGPIMLAGCFDRFHTYAPAFQILSGSLLIVGVASWFVPIPRPEDASRRAALSESEFAAEPVATPHGN